jgi:hypothetical protein
MAKKYIKQRMRIEDIQANLDELPPIKFKGNVTYKTIRGIINKAIDNNYHTDNRTYCSKTGRLQCYSHRRRGIADLYRLCKYYIPDVTLQQVVNHMKHRKHTAYGYCFTTNQDVFRHTEQESHNWSLQTLEPIKCERNDPAIRLKNRKRVYIETT